MEAGYLSLVMCELSLFDHRQLVQSGFDYPTLCDLLSIRHGILTMDPSSTEVREGTHECPRCTRYYHDRVWCFKQNETNWFPIDNQTSVCSLCFKEWVSPTEFFRNFPYTLVAEKQGPALIRTTFKEEFEALDNFERDL